MRRILHAPERRNTILRGDRPLGRGQRRLHVHNRGRRHVSGLLPLRPTWTHPGPRTRGTYRIRGERGRASPGEKPALGAGRIRGIEGQQPGLVWGPARICPPSSIPTRPRRPSTGTRPSSARVVPKERRWARRGPLRPGAVVAGRRPVEHDAGRPDPDRRPVRLLQRRVLGRVGEQVRHIHPGRRRRRPLQGRRALDPALDLDRLP